MVTDQIKKTKTITHYDYDAFGRRTLVQDEGGKIIRTLYDGLSFDIIREQETFADGYFTNTSDTGIAWGAVSEGDGSRYRYIGDDAPAAREQNGYSVTASNRASSRVALYANGQAVGVTRSSNYASSERSYFGTDLMGTVRSSTTDSGNAEYYEYDVFGKPYGENVSDYAYTGKPYDPTTGMYNYGYRDYVPQTARFSTIDPIRDGNNWFAYCNNEPVNFLDAWGLKAGDVTFSPDLFDLNRPAPFSDWGVYPGQEVLNGSREGYLATIQSLVGTNYVWGGNDPITDGGLDCSGAVLYGINQQGNTVPDQRADDIYTNYTDPVDVENIQAGDLRFIDWDNDGTMDHVQTITSPNGDRINPLGGPENTSDNPGSIELITGTLPESGEIRRLRFEE